jgi:hypothetical protein
MRSLSAFIMIILLGAVFLNTVSLSVAKEEYSSGWGIAELIETEDESASYPEVDFDGNGNAIAVWNQNDGSITQIRSARYVNGHGWTDACYITSGSNNAISPKMAVDRGGNATAVWQQNDGSRYKVGASRYTPGMGWEAFSYIDSLDMTTYGPEVGMDNMGNAHAVWYQSDGTRYNIWTNTYTSGSGWGTAGLIETDDTNSAYRPKISVAGNGNAVAVWHQSDGIRQNVWANVYSYGTGWGTADKIESFDTGDADNPVVGVDSMGSAVAVWRQYDGSTWDLVSSTYSITSGWGTPVVIDSEDSTIQNNFDIDMNPSGEAVAVWYQWDGSAVYDIHSNGYSHGSGWGTSDIIDDTDFSAESPNVAIDLSGNAIAVWKEYDGTSTSIYSSVYTSGIGWGDPEPIEDLGLSADVPRIAIDTSGNAIAVWYQINGYSFDVWANVYQAPDNTPPTLTVTAPWNSHITERDSIEVTGTTEPGSLVSVNGMLARTEDNGSFSAFVDLFPGMNIITVVSEDEAGNRATISRQVIFADPLITLTNDLMDLADTVSNLTVRMSLLDNDLSSLEDALSLVEDEISLLSVDLRNASMEILSLIENVTTLLGELNDTRNDIDSARDDISEISEDLDSTDGRLLILEALIETLESALNSTDSELQLVLERLDAQGSEIDTLSAEQDSLKDKMDSLPRDEDEDDDGILPIIVGITIALVLILAVVMISMFASLRRRLSGEKEDFE